jgi:hypothetical protein
MQRKRTLESDMKAAYFSLTPESAELLGSDTHNLAFPARGSCLALAGYINSTREVLKVREEKIATITLDAECTSFSDLRVTSTLLADQRRD